MHPGVSLVDLRSPDAYNGWALDGEKRGGHIPGARSLPATWTRYIDWFDIVQAKGLLNAAMIVLYGSSALDRDRVAQMLERAGLKDLAVYAGFSDEWLTDPQLPLEVLTRYKQLVPPVWLRERLARHDVVICHCHYDNLADYRRGHIPGAIALDTMALEAPETWNRRPAAELRAAFERHGITRDTTVVFYGRDSVAAPDDPFPGKSAGSLAAMRAAVISLYAGVRDVRVLNGGLHAWETAGYALAHEPTVPVPAIDFGSKLPAEPGLMIDTPEVKTMLAAQDGLLVGMRSRPEYEGRVSGYNYIKVKGRIPGEVFGNCGQDAYHMDNFRNPDGTTLEYPQIVASLAAAGITPERRVVFFCGTGWRASEAFYNTWLMGWPRIAVYDGGWFEWSADPANPIETGSPSG